MKTHWKSDEGSSPLPPPPAPTARDANPWPMPEQYGDRPSQPSRHGAQVRAQPKAPFGAAGSPTRHAAPAGSATPVAQAPPPSFPAPLKPQPSIHSPGGERVAARGLPLLIILGALVAALIAARRAIAGGDFAGAVGPVLIAGVIAFSWWRRSRRP